MSSENEKFEVYGAGAKRQSSPPYYRVIPHTFLKRLGETLKEGAAKYSEGPDDCNWQKGDKRFAVDCFDHMIDHLYAWREGLMDEDHLGHAAANMAFLAWFQEQGIWDPSEKKLKYKERVEPPAEIEDKESRNSRLWDIIKRGVAS